MFKLKEALIAGALLVLMSAGAAIAASFATPQQSDSRSTHQVASLQCADLDALDYPAAHWSSAAQQTKLEGCNPLRLYYGLGAPADPVSARLCALHAAHAGDEDASAVLLMVYANGQGVPRDYQLAKKAACRLGGAQAELRGRLAHLSRMQAGQEGVHPQIDFCDDITSGDMQGRCALVQAHLKRQAQLGEILKLTANWSDAQKKAFAQLQVRAETFTSLRSRQEVDQTGSGRVADVVYEESKLRDDFLASLKSFENGDIPRFSEHEFAALDSELNKLYQQRMKAGDSESTDVTVAGIKQTQRSWIAYRDAWVTFAKSRYPSVSAFAWKAFFTQKRCEMLKELAP